MKFYCPECFKEYTETLTDDEFLNLYLDSHSSEKHLKLCPDCKKNGEKNGR